jgi:hypothetical protein
MSQASDYLELKILDHIVGKTSFTMPTAYVALLTSAPSDADTGSTITEANYTGYARVSTAGADWNAAAAGAISNANDITFGECTGGSSNCTHFAIVDAASAGNMLAYGTLDTAMNVVTGVTPKFAGGTPGGLQVTMA